MKYLIFVILSINFASAEDLRPIPGYAEARIELAEKIKNLQDEFAKRESEYYLSNIRGKLHAVELATLPNDPKASEVKSRREADEYNQAVSFATVNIDPHMWVSGKWPACFWQQVGKLPDFRGVRQEVANQPPDKKKAKITATLSDGTKVE